MATIRNKNDARKFRNLRLRTVLFPMTRSSRPCPGPTMDSRLNVSSSAPFASSAVNVVDFAFGVAVVFGVAVAVGFSELLIANC